MSNNLIDPSAIDTGSRIIEDTIPVDTKKNVIAPNLYPPAKEKDDDEIFNISTNSVREAEAEEEGENGVIVEDSALGSDLTFDEPTSFTIASVVEKVNNDNQTLKEEGKPPETATLFTEGELVVVEIPKVTFTEQNRANNEEKKITITEIDVYKKGNSEPIIAMLEGTKETTKQVNNPDGTTEKVVETNTIIKSLEPEPEGIIPLDTDTEDQQETSKELQVYKKPNQNLESIKETTKKSDEEKPKIEIEVGYISISDTKTDTLGNQENVQAEFLAEKVQVESGLESDEDESENEKSLECTQCNLFYSELSELKQMRLSECTNYLEKMKNVTAQLDLIQKLIDNQTTQNGKQVEALEQKLAFQSKTFEQDSANAKQLYQEKIEALNQEINKFKSEKDEVSKQLEMARKQCDQNQNSIKSVENVSEKKTLYIGILLKKIDTLESCQSYAHDSDLKIMTLDSNISRLGEALKKKNTEIDSYKKQLELKSKEISIITDVSKKLTTTESENTMLKNKIQMLQSENIALAAKNRDWGAQVDKLSAAVNSDLAESQSYKQIIEEYERQDAIRQSEMTRIIDSVKKAKIIFETQLKKTENNLLNDMIKSLKSLVEKIEKKMMSLSSEDQSTREFLSGLRAIISQKISNAEAKIRN